MTTRIKLPKLECLIVENCRFSANVKTMVELVKSSRSFWAFKGRLTISDFTKLEAKSRKEASFANLEAYELITVWPILVRRLVPLDMPPRYLCIGNYLLLLRFQLLPTEEVINKDMDAFYSLLSKLNLLEVLVILWSVQVNVETIKLLTKRQRKLKSQSSTIVSQSLIIKKISSNLIDESDLMIKRLSCPLNKCFLRRIRVETCQHLNSGYEMKDPSHFFKVQRQVSQFMDDVVKSSTVNFD